MPGGRIRPGEDDQQAVTREVAEETGLDVEVTGYLGSVVRPAPGGAVFDIHDYACRLAYSGGKSATLRAGDDADAVRWCDAATLVVLPVVDGLIEALTGWGCLPRGASEDNQGDYNRGSGRPGWSPPRACP